MLNLKKQQKLIEGISLKDVTRRMKPFTIVLPIKGTDVEKKLFKKSILSAINLNPDELILGVDNPFNLELKKQILELVEQTGYNKLRFIEVEKSGDWNFQLAHVVWECYKAAKYDKIFSYDIDSTICSTILLGYDKIGTNNIACISFTKRMPINTPQKLIRYISHRLRIRSSEYCFTGCYWIWRPFYFEYMKKEDYMKIKNGVDGILVDKILDHPTYKLVTRKEIGARCYTIGNEDYDWRQFQDGIWMWANKQDFVTKRRKILAERKASMNRNPKMKKRIRYQLSVKYLRCIESNFWVYLLSKVFMYQYWNLLKGYLWASKHQEAEIVKVAVKHDVYEFSYLGVKLLPKRKWKDANKTGFNI